MLPYTSCGLPERLARAMLNALLFNLAPGGVYHATNVTIDAVCSYHAFSPLPLSEAVFFLWHLPWAHTLQALPGTLPCGARTFLYAIAQRLSDQLCTSIT